MTSEISRLMNLLEGIRKDEGFADAKNAVADWFDMLDELKRGGQNVYEIQENLKQAGGRLKLLPEKQSAGNVYPHGNGKFQTGECR